ncbi:MAG: methylmalonyl Co-A mutase-associated GTPase MeaB [Flavobacteriaceae bacterium]|nr:methylmalonyl Co-A mutase-associated GTPase MeaB [Flavobacteriaceae bacterium]
MSKEEKHTSALHEKDGIQQPPSVNPNIKGKVKPIDSSQYISEIKSGNTVFLSKAITLIESKNNKHKEKANEILQGCLTHHNKSARIGITGVPGVGKSTFIEALGNYLTSLGSKVAVLAVDPSSSISKGSILGDKTRMEDLVKNPDAFIRPSPSGNSLGGVARKTRETIMLCEAAGYDIIIVETVGVGQSETAVHSMVDFFLLLKLAGAGDQLQGIKRGIIEMADAIVINKADGDNVKRAKLARTEFKRALQLYPPAESGWIPQVTTCSAIKKDNIDGVWNIITEFLDTTQKNDSFQTRRAQQNKFWLLQTIEEQLKDNFYQHQEIKNKLSSYIEKVESGTLSPFKAAEELLNLLSS